MSNAINNPKIFKCYKFKDFSNKLKTLKNSLIYNIKEFSKNSTLHGLNYLVNKDLYPLERYVENFIKFVIHSIKDYPISEPFLLCPLLL